MLLFCAIPALYIVFYIRAPSVRRSVVDALNYEIYKMNRFDLDRFSIDPNKGRLKGYRRGGNNGGDDELLNRMLSEHAQKHNLPRLIHFNVKHNQYRTVVQPFLNKFGECTVFEYSVTLECDCGDVYHFPVFSRTRLSVENIGPDLIPEWDRCRPHVDNGTYTLKIVDRTEVSLNTMQADGRPRRSLVNGSLYHLHPSFVQPNSAPLFSISEANSCNLKYYYA